MKCASQGQSHRVLRIDTKAQQGIDAVSTSNILHVCLLAISSDSHSLMRTFENAVIRYGISVFANIKSGSLVQQIAILVIGVDRKDALLHL